MIVKVCQICKGNIILAKGKCRRCYQKEYMKEYQQRSYVKKKMKEYMKEYQQRPYVKKKMKEYMKEYIKTDKWREISRNNMRMWRAKKYFNMTLQEYENIISCGCSVCGFKEVIDLHHKDFDKTNNAPDNFIPLCPNHHKLIHINKRRI